MAREPGTRAAGLAGAAALALLAVAAPAAVPRAALVPAVAATDPLAPAAGDSLPAAAPAPDTSLSSFLHAMADSSDAFFGMSAAPVDTAGLDSALAFRLANPDSADWPTRRRLPVELAPSFRFNRVDGPVYGGRVALGRAGGHGRVELRPTFAAGPNRWLGDVRLLKAFPRRAALWGLEAGWERRTHRIGSDVVGGSLTTVRALLNGSDRGHYLRREGPYLELRRDGWRHTLLAGYRDQEEDSLPVTALWNLLGREPAAAGNLSARPGRVRAFRYGAGASLGPWPLELWGTYETSSRRAGSDFEYRRWRAVAGAVTPVTDWAALHTQASYGRLTGEPLPQASFALGGSHSLRSLPSYGLIGTRMALLRSELVLAPDLLELAHVPHPSLLHLQGGAFAATGAVWGEDPFTGARFRGTDWPAARDFRSEVGLGLLYRPGVPDPLGYFRFDLAWPVGSHAGPPRITLSYARLLELLPRIGR